MPTEDRPAKTWVQPLAAVAGLVLILAFLFGGPDDPDDEKAGINEQAAADLENGDRPEVVLAPPPPQRSPGEEAYLTELPEGSLFAGYRDCDDLPDAEADDGLYSFGWLVESMGRIADSVYDDEWKTRQRIAATHLCPEKKAIVDLAASRAVPNFDDGTYQVNVSIPAGIWRVEDTGTCYWERTRADGEIIDNSFVRAAQRIDVSIRPTDGFFNSRECGTWFKVG